MWYYLKGLIKDSKIMCEKRVVTLDIFCTRELGPLDWVVCESEKRKIFLWQPFFTVQSHFSHCSFVVETITEPYHAFQSWKHNARRTGQAEDVWWLEVKGLYYDFILSLKFPRQANHFTNQFSRTSCRSCVSRGSCTFGSSLGFSLSSTCTDPDGWCPSPSSSVFRFFFFLFAPFSSKATTRGV